MLRKLSFRSTLVLHWSCLQRKSNLLLVRHQVWRLKRKESSSKVLEMQSQVKPSMLKERLRLLSHHCCVILPPLPPLDISIFKSTTQDNRKWPRNKKLFKKKKRRKREWRFLSDKCLELSSQFERMEKWSDSSSVFLHHREIINPSLLIEKREKRGIWLIWKTKAWVSWLHNHEFFSTIRGLCFFIYRWKRTRVRVFLPFSAEITRVPSALPTISVWQVGEQPWFFLFLFYFIFYLGSLGLWFYYVSQQFWFFIYF